MTALVRKPLPPRPQFLRRLIQSALAGLGVVVGSLAVGQIALVLIWILLSLAFLLLADRKIWAAVQIRRGPNVVGPWGLLQSFADLLKFALKEPTIPSGANKGVFLLAPLVNRLMHGVK